MKSLHFVFHAGLFCLMAIQAQASPIVFEGDFGRLVLDVQAPAISELFLRKPDGELDAQSLLSPMGKPWLRETPTWGTQAYTYVVDADGRRYESRFDAPGKVRQTPGRIVLTDVKLSNGLGKPPVALENWILQARGADLIWTVERTWLRDFTARLTASPALFFSNRPYDPEKALVLQNCVSTTLWINPDRIKASFDPLYRPSAFIDQYILSRNNVQVIDTPDTWAILKLWTNWHHRMDLRLAVKGGHLFRRGWFGWCSEVGAVESGDYPLAMVKGQTQKTMLTIQGVDKFDTGYQLQVSLPDKVLEATLKDWYGSLFNGGVVCDQKNYDMGNESDGWYYGGSSWMQGVALQAGVPAPGKLAPEPFDIAGALREKTRHVISTLRPDNRTQYGYNVSADFVDDNLHNIIGTRIYMLHSGDAAYAAQQIPDMERMLQYYLERFNGDGVFDFNGTGHWYYDAMPSSGVNLYHNTFLYKALVDLAEMERATGIGNNAERYEKVAADLRKAINKVFWNENAPCGPRYSDWIQPDGTRIEYAADICQFAPVALGVASIEQGRRLLATLDRRIAVLEKDFDYAGRASLSAYWPVPDAVNPLPWQRKFGVYMNGGSFMAQTYWEIMARARCDDAEGALDRLEKFAEGLHQTSFMGNNWYDMQGNVGFSPADEPYLSDMIAVSGSLINGLLGINPTWDQLAVNPHLPKDWNDVAADVVYKGFRHHITIRSGQVSVEKKERVITPPAQLTWEIRPNKNPSGKIGQLDWQKSVWTDPEEVSNWKANIARTWNNNDGWMADEGIDVHDGQFITLSRIVSKPDLLVLLPLGGDGSDFRDASDYAGMVEVQGTGITIGSDGPAGGISACFLNGAGELVLGDTGRFAFGAKDSFTMQGWFKTDARGNMVIIARPGAWCLGVKEGRLAGWVMQDDGRVIEARGLTDVTDGQWRHAACVVDRRAQRVALYLDGRLDACPSNPLDISSLGAGAQSQPVYVGGFGSSFYFRGALAGVSIHRGVLTPDGFSYPQPYVPVTQQAGKYASRGVYQARSCCWGNAAEGLSVAVESRLQDGRVNMTLDLSDDGFETIMASETVALIDGTKTYRLPGIQGTHHTVRVRFELEAAPSGDASPQVIGVRMTASPSMVD